MFLYRFCVEDTTFVKVGEPGWLKKTLDNYRTMFVTSAKFLTDIVDQIAIKKLAGSSASASADQILDDDSEVEGDDEGASSAPAIVVTPVDPFDKLILCPNRRCWRTSGASLKTILSNFEYEFSALEKWMKGVPKQKNNVMTLVKEAVLWFKKESSDLEKSAWKSDLHLFFFFLRRPRETRKSASRFLFNLFTREGYLDARSCLSFHKLCTPKLIAFLYQVNICVCSYVSSKKAVTNDFSLSLSLSLSPPPLFFSSAAPLYSK